MTTPSGEEKPITKILSEMSGGRADADSLDELLPLVYDELRRLAHAHLRNERSDHTLQPTALVHEAYLKLIGGDGAKTSWENRAHFFGIAARLMRQILVDHARGRGREKRGGGQTLIALDDSISFYYTADVEILNLHESLERLAELDARQAKIVDLRFFGGLTIDETVAVLNVSVATVTREWEMAKAWLFRALKTEN